MATETIKAEGLLEIDLSNFKIIKMTEVFRVDEQGLNPQSLGLFRVEHIAKAFAGQKDSQYLKTQSVVVLTNGDVLYRIADQEKPKLFDDEAEALKIKEVALEKLTPEEKVLLGLQ